MRNLPPTVRKLYEVANQHKVTIPAEIRRDLDGSLTVIERAETATFTGATIGEAVTAALTADRDPVTDPDVHAAIVRDKLQSTQTINQIVETSSTLLYSAASGHIEQIIEAFKPAFDKAGATFTKAVQQLSDAGFTSLDAGGHPNLELARANIQAREADVVMREIRNATASLLVIIGHKNGTPLSNIVDRLDTDNTPAFELLQTLTAGWTLWDAVLAGYTISLATPTETDDRAIRAYAAQEAQTLSPERAIANAFRGSN